MAEYMKIKKIDSKQEPYPLQQTQGRLEHMVSKYQGLQSLQCITFGLYCVECSVVLDD